MFDVNFEFLTRIEWLLNSVENFIRLTRSFKDLASHGTRLVAWRKSICRCSNFFKLSAFVYRKFFKDMFAWIIWKSLNLELQSSEHQQLTVRYHYVVDWFEFKPRKISLMAKSRSLVEIISFTSQWTQNKKMIHQKFSKDLFASVTSLSMMNCFIILWSQKLKSLMG